MSSVAGALCFVASVFVDDRGLNGRADLCEGWLPSARPTFSPAASAASQGRRKTIPSLEMDSLTIAAAPTSVWVACGEEKIHRCPVGEPLSSPQGFLMANPPGPYTCARSVGNRSAAMLQFHLDRLWESAEATGLGPAARAEGRRSLERRTTDIITRVMESFWEENRDLNNGGPECMATVLYACGGSSEDTEKGLDGAGRSGGEEGQQGTSPLHILAHAWPLPAPSPKGGDSGVPVLVAGSGRSLPRAKHSSWLRDRKPLDELKAQAGAQEVVLSEAKCSPDGASRRLILEGLVSNFFVVEEDGAVCTAPSGVLGGAMRQLVISACTQEGIVVRLEAPDLARAIRWREAFLTGTGRILAPISALLVPEDGQTDGNAKSFRSTISRIELPVMETEADARRGSGMGREDRATSVAGALRGLLHAELSRTATRLF